MKCHCGRVYVKTGDGELVVKCTDCGWYFTKSVPPDGYFCIESREALEKLFIEFLVELGIIVAIQGKD